MINIKATYNSEERMHDIVITDEQGRDLTETLSPHHLELKTMRGVLVATMSIVVDKTELEGVPFRIEGNTHMGSHFDDPKRSWIISEF